MTTSHTHTNTDATQAVFSQDGAKINYLSVGSGPSVIVIPGALSTAADYSTFASALAEHFTVYTIERRGRGQSSPQGDDYSITKECQDLLALQQKTGATLLVGHSFGGLVALEAARNNPIFTKIAVYEPGVSIDNSIPTDWMTAYEQKLAQNQDLDAFIEFIRGMNPASTGNTPPWLMKIMLPLVMSAHERKQILSLLSQNLREHKEVARLNNTYQNYRQISASVLLMYGGKNQTPQAEQRITQLAAIFPGAQTQKFPKLDHFGIDKKAPQEVARAITSYFLN